MMMIITQLERERWAKGRKTLEEKGKERSVFFYATDFLYIHVVLGEKEAKRE